ncbi:hypothetical protein JNO12_12970 [Erwinia aphidicola]|nr:hypothetical protein [Erwinia aphidicola]
MNSSDIPSRITKAFGVNGLRNTIPTESSTTTDNNGVATFDKGFPAITMQPLSAGGIPPSGKDVNGTLYSVTQQQQWQNAGMSYPFSADFASAIGGYPKGALLPNSTVTGQWLNLSEGNTSPPETSAIYNTGWAPSFSYGLTSLTGLSGGNVTLTQIQASRSIIVLNGALTQNLVLIMPPWAMEWRFVNKCSGSFSAVVRTQTGVSAPIPAGVNSVYCDGTDFFKVTGTAAQYDAGSSTGQIPTMASFSSGNGFQYLPGGIVIQTGAVVMQPGVTSGNVTLPKVLISGIRSIQITGSSENGSDPGYFTASPTSLTSFNWWRFGSTLGTAFTYLVIGK